MTTWWGRDALVVGLFALGCGSSSKQVKPGGKAPATEGGKVWVEPRACDHEGKRVERHDLDRDGKDDVWLIHDANRGTLLCRQVDYDHDGVKDHIITFDASGALLTEDHDFEPDGKLDARYHYQGGVVTLIERDGDHDQRPDVWETYAAGGGLERVERDRNGDGKPDLWEAYHDGVLASARYDDDYDQKVDRTEDAPPAAPAPEAPAPEAPAPDAEAPAEPAAGA